MSEIPKNQDPLEVTETIEKSENETIIRKIEKIKELHALWLTEPEETRGNFGPSWLKRNGGGFYNWLLKNGGDDFIINTVGGEVAKDYEREYKEDFTEKSAIEELRKAHAKWRERPEEERVEFGPTWLIRHYSGSLNRWLRNNGGALHFAQLAGGEVEEDFRQRNAKYHSHESAADELREAHAKWRTLPEDKRGVFGPVWLQKHYGGLYSWMKRNSNLDSLIQKIGGEVATDYERVYRRDRTLESAADELREAHAKWKALPEDKRGTFGPAWIEKNYSGFYIWITKNSNLDSLIQKIGGEVATDYERVYRRDRTLESAADELREAHAKWKALPEDKRGTFGPAWLQRHYSGFYLWIKRNSNLDFLIQKIGGEVEEDFEYVYTRNRTEKSAIEELVALHTKWKALPEDKRGVFGPKFLKNNDYGLYLWIIKKYDLVSFIINAGSDIAKDFIKVESIYDRTIDQAIQEFREEYSKWKALSTSTEKRGDFGSNWLNKNNNKRLYRWIIKNGGIFYVAKQAGGEIADYFQKRHLTKERTIESAIQELREAYEKWQSKPEEVQPIFGSKWLHLNNPGFYEWILKNGGIYPLAKQAGGELAEYFQKRRLGKERTKESVIQELRETFKKWQAEPEDDRPIFGPGWLSREFPSLYWWMKNNDDFEYFCTQAGGDIAEYFEKNKKIIRTKESGINEIISAHAKWKALPDEQRGTFGPAWLQRNYSGFYVWMKNNGGLDYFINQAGKEIKKDFQRIHNTERTYDTVIDELREAHTEWLSLPENKGKFFGPGWLQKNKGSLYGWIIRNGGMEKFVKIAGGELENDFDHRTVIRDRTLDSSILELQAAHAKWTTLSQESRGSFNLVWLHKNVRGLYEWASKNGGMERLISLAGDPVLNDFSTRFSEQSKIIELDNFLIEAADGKSSESKLFQSVINVVGPSRCLDLLYKFRPEFKSIPVERVKGALADYLGNFLTLKQGFNFKDVSIAADYLSDLTFREGLFETFKDHCLRFYFEERQKDQARSSQEIIYNYLDFVTKEFHHLNKPLLDDVIQDVVIYYNSVLRDFHKPEQFIDRLNPSREFPDINQRINMKELADKKRLLIADEMGLGKSASVIMAKEQLGVRCALIIAPSNVLETWHHYLSENETEGRGGYYKSGQAPKVLRIENIEQIKPNISENFDYILISQERMNEKYTEALSKTDYGMMIVDEMHKIKSLDGIRSEQVIKLAELIQGEDKYLALLSGTPVPNKVEDVAIALKLLYPDKFEEISNRSLVQQIIGGDIVELRSLLMPRMQMKSIEESVEIPPLNEDVEKIELSTLEKDIYEVLIENDELTASEKMIILRQFLLNPEIIDATPGIPSAKINALNEKLATVFDSKNKVAVFFNDYVEGVIRGEKTIIEKLNLPPDTTVKIIHGEISANERAAIQTEFNTTNKKILLLISGQTADVGVDFTGAEQVIFYNEPWTEYQRRQELARAHRPGLKHPLESTTIMAAGTIEEGIHEYIARKYQAVEKLLHGIPLTELEQELLRQDEKNTEPDMSVNPELAAYYFSTWDKMMKIFGHVREMGEENFKKFISEYGEDYAEGYIELGSRSYQANANRVTGTVIRLLAEKNGTKSDKLSILDMASGPEMLKKHIKEDYQGEIYSMDMNREHFTDFRNIETRTVGSFNALPYADKAFNYINLNLAIHYTNFVPSKEKLERLQVLREINRVLKIGGSAVINLIYSAELKNKLEFEKTIGDLGFKINHEFTGEIKVKDNYRSGLITLEKITDIDCKKPVQEIAEKMGKEKLDGLKLIKTKAGVKDSRRLITDFEINEHQIQIELNETDQEILQEEQITLQQGEELKKRFGKIENIPANIIVHNNFVRIRIGEKYILFKKFTKGTGVVLIK